MYITTVLQMIICRSA